MPVVIVVSEGEIEFPLALILDIGRSRIFRSLYFNGLKNQRVNAPEGASHHQKMFSIDTIHISLSFTLHPAGLDWFQQQNHDQRILNYDQMTRTAFDPPFPLQTSTSSEGGCLTLDIRFNVPQAHIQNKTPSHAPIPVTVLVTERGNRNQKPGAPRLAAASVKTECQPLQWLEY
ncbi:hypothetical protein AVEN_132796-1 [Araneus ventricosus]|uniref:Uncharacterized protein n=1 Tax=Araneus ventricosus TaxID=182803 RepID=A0A4Y2WQI8_ARAVE|nr:hypothetical protein AVEN_132796-1 [Araneus ventricosus]